MVRAALFLDFDNVFSALSALDEGAAYDFAMDPGRWLHWFQGDGGRAQGGRRFLLCRCYMNPGGWYAPQPGGWLASWLDQPRLYFSRFRTAFVRAGFQVIDCPPLARSKNGADIQIALDVVDALAAPVAIDEFVIMSSDSDFTPLLHRLRLHDRGTALVVQEAVAPALVAAADRVLALSEFARLALPPESPMALSPEAQRAELLALLRRALGQSEAAIGLPQLGQQLMHLGGDWLRATNYAGYGSLGRFLREERPPDIAWTPGPGGGWLHDPLRHPAPESREAAEPVPPSPPPAPPADPAGCPAGPAAAPEAPTTEHG
jgi:hypothetical protein